ncbi:hypothetical protein WJX84_008973 [Apatococcus fuscideae]|uniref:Uncharacterized protein n=1 Tax=Apatococcus fuscideae TaxID=2026836 RepID=A0AAW1SNC9_9CHLO
MSSSLGDELIADFEAPAAKRVKHEGSSVAAPPAATPPGAAQSMAGALQRLATHIVNPKKMKKASTLLRQLLSEKAIDESHSALVFEALRAAMRKPEHATEPTLIKEYERLFTTASKHADMFTPRQKGQLDVYGVWGVWRGQLHSDDSFDFNKAAGRIKDSISHLPPATEQDDALLTAVQASMKEEAERLHEEPTTIEPEPAAPAEPDPFGLDALIPDPARLKAEGVWTTAEALCMKREALLDCLETMRERHRLPWARTSVDIAIEDAWNARAKFCTPQKERLDELMRFVREQRVLRKKGLSAKESKRDQTSFEAARAAWGKQTISARGALGGGADHHTEVWLG